MAVQDPTSTALPASVLPGTGVPEHAPAQQGARHVTARCKHGADRQYAQRDTPTSMTT
eukprot:m.1374677 g.1374677  ORF g.1374677 m.1374677 type:complete len:58 (-) comp24960_c1_seq8:2374-2547(-)